MSDIIRKKLELENGEQPITVWNYLNVILRAMDRAASQINLKSLCNKILQKKTLVRRLEVVMSNSLCASDRPSIVALGLIQSEVERYLASESKSGKMNEYAMGTLQLLKIVVDLKKTCAVSWMFSPNSFLTLCVCFSRSIPKNSTPASTTWFTYSRSTTVTIVFAFRNTTP